MFALATKIPEEPIVWDIEVAKPGSYEAKIYYTCRPTDIGSTIELSFQGNKLAGSIAASHDPPLRGMEHGRVSRNESYVKNFTPMELGTIELVAGKARSPYKLQI